MIFMQTLWKVDRWTASPEHHPSCKAVGVSPCQEVVCLWDPMFVTLFTRGRDSVVGTMSHYGLEIECRWGEIFRTRPDRSWIHHPSSCKMGAGSLFRRENVRDVALTTQPHLASKIKKEWSCSASGSSWPVLGWTSLFKFTRPRYWTLSWASQIQSRLSCRITLTFSWVFVDLRVGLPSSLFPLKLCAFISILSCVLLGLGQGCKMFPGI
jgi:hypothetical protein